MAILVFDLETQHLAEEVGGWEHIDRLKLAVAVTADLETGEMRRYREADVEDLLAGLRAASLVIGFNIQRFDYEVLRPYAGGQPLQPPTLDLLSQVQAALGFRLSLDALAAGSLERGKSADGRLAVQWYREGKIDQLLDYCEQDVIVTRDLYEYGRKNGFLQYRDKFGRLKRVPVRW
jgi:DEAD/DEAH box helicase domain-containing protein